MITEDDLRTSAPGNWWSTQTLLGRGDAPALVVDDGVATVTVTYAELAGRVECRRDELGVGRRLVRLESDPGLEFVVTLLAALDAGHPLLLTEPDDRHGIDDVYRPDAIVSCAGEAVAIDHRTAPEAPSAHDLHPDLAMLLGTSGSTGSPKLVRLSLPNLASNAHAIASYLALTARDRAITSLPMHYCYGLSVLTSHIAVGASVVLTRASVVDPCFRASIDRHGVTGLSGVPFTFELLEHTERSSNGGVLGAPSLRYVTQAGGRLAPERVVELATRGRRSGWDLFVMYGQTEATARMAYLPPDDAFEHPSAVGVAIPGGHLRVDTDAAPAGAGVGVGEVVYRGPNVMLGYAHGPDDLGRGRDVDELRTGDLGRFDERGLLEIVGRLRRFVKIHGQRIDLDRLQSALADGGDDVLVVGDDDGIVVARVAVAVGGTCDRTHVHASPASDLRRAAASAVSIPEGRIVAVEVDEIPRTGAGKIDGPRLVELARAADRRSPTKVDGPSSVAGEGGDGSSVAETFRQVLGAPAVGDDDTFVGLGGDSLSYVEASIRLEEQLGAVPVDWHLRRVGELERLRAEHRRRPAQRRRTVQIETSVVIRAIGIALIVCTHMRLYRLPGGAHTLLAVVGYNIARFQLAPFDVVGRLRRAASTIARVAVPTSAWIGLNMAVVGGYSLGAVLLVNNYTGAAARRDGRWEYWYFEVFVQVMVVVALVFSIGAVRRAERRAPFLFAFGVLAATLVFRFDVVQWGGEYNEMFRTHTVACFVALGWCAQRATTTARRLLVTAATVATTVGYFGQTDREWRIILLVSAMIWLPTIRLPRHLAAVVGRVAAASMWIFLVHWQVWPLFTSWLDRHVAYLATIAVGVGFWWVAYDVSRRWAEWRSPTSAQLDERTIGRSTNAHVSAPDTAISVSDARPVTA